MGRRSRSRRHPLEAIPAFVGLVLLLIFFGPPQLAQFLTIAGIGILGLGGVVVVVLVVRAIIKRRQRAEPDWFAAPNATAPQPVAPRPAPPVWTPVITVSKPEAPAWNLELLRSLEWKRFEDVVAAYFRWEGLRAQTTRIGPDGGVDVYLFRDGESAPLAVVQCKAWNAYKVGIKPVRELLGVMASEKIAKGYFITTGTFTEEAREFARTNPLTLIDGQELLRRVEALPEGARHQLLQMVTAGDYTTPTCPRCGVKMVRRTARTGGNPGSEFWGCPTYPRCRSTLRMAAE